MSSELYDDVIASLELDANPPAGAILHVVAQGEDEILVSEIWRTEQTFLAFHEHRFVPALQMRGVVTRPTVEISPLHNLWAVEVDTIERMGAVSLPAHHSGAAL